MRGRWGWLGNRALVRSLLSFGFAFTAEWAFTVAIGLVAFADGGALAVGLVGLLRLRAGRGAGAGDHDVRRPDAARARARGLEPDARRQHAGGRAGAGARRADLVVYVLAMVSSIAFTPYRASHSALMPSLCRTPDELTAVNVVRGALDSTSVVVGPWSRRCWSRWPTSPPSSRSAALCALVSAVLVLRLGYERIPLPRRVTPGVRREVVEGFVAVGTYPGVAVVVALVAAADGDPGRLQRLRAGRRPRAARRQRVERGRAAGRGRDRGARRQPAVHATGRQPGR